MRLLGRMLRLVSVAAMRFIAALEDAACVEISGKYVHAGVMQQEVHCIGGGIHAMEAC